MCHTHHIKHVSENAADTRLLAHLLETLGLDASAEKLSPEECRVLSSMLGALRRQFEAMQKRGGVVIVSDAETLITAYRCGSLNSRYQDPKAHCRPLSGEERRWAKNFYQVGCHAQP